MKGKFFAPLQQRYVVEFLDTILDPIVVEGLIDEYRLGVTHSRAAIFFQIDAEGRCRTVKMMMYDPETGHRIKDYQQLRRSRGDVNVFSIIRYSQAGIDGHGAAAAR